MPPVVDAWARISQHRHWRIRVQDYGLQATPPYKLTSAGAGRTAEAWSSPFRHDDHARRQQFEAAEHLPGELSRFASLQRHPSIVMCALCALRPGRVVVFPGHVRGNDVAA